MTEIDLCRLAQLLGRPLGVILDREPRDLSLMGTVRRCFLPIGGEIREVA